MCLCLFASSSGILVFNVGHPKDVQSKDEFRVFSLDAESEIRLLGRVPHARLIERIELTLCEEQLSRNVN